MKKFIFITLSLITITSLYSCNSNKELENKKKTIALTENKPEAERNIPKETSLETQHIIYTNNQPTNIKDKDIIKEIDDNIEKTLNSIDDEVQMCLDKTLLTTIKEKQPVIEVSYNSQKTLKFIQKFTKEETSYTYEKLYILLDTKKLSSILDNAIILQNGHKYDMFTSTFNRNLIIENGELKIIN